MSALVCLVNPWTGDGYFYSVAASFTLVIAHTCFVSVWFYLQQIPGVEFVGVVPGCSVYCGIRDCAYSAKMFVTPCFF